jgi:hypothetical protein
MNIKEFFDSDRGKEEYHSSFIKLSKKSVKKIEKQVRKIKLNEERETDKLESIRSVEDKIDDIEIPEIEITSERISMREFERDLSRMKFKGKTINKAILEGIEIEKLNYWGVIRFIYEFIGDYQEINKNCTINIKEGRHNTKGYVHISGLDISVQGVTSERSMKEIFSQILGNNFSFSIEIMGNQERIIFYNL